MKPVAQKHKGNGEENIRFIETKDYKPQIAHTYVEYRTNDGYEKRQVSTVELRGKSETIVLEGKPLSRFLSIIEFGKRAFTKQLSASRDETQKLLEKKYKASSMIKFQLQEENKQVIRITSERYVGVDNSLVEDIITKRLEQEGIEYIIKENKKFGNNYKQIELQNMKFAHDTGMTSTITYFNLNTGLNAIHIVGGALVQVCSNGLIAGKVLKDTQRLVHKQDMKEYERKINNRIGQILEVLETITQEVVALRKIKVNVDQAKSIISFLKIPQYIQASIQSRLFTESLKTYNGKMDFDGTLYGVYMAMTYVGTHMQDIQMSKNRITSVNLTQTMKMQALETLQDGYADYKKQVKKMKEESANIPTPKIK